MTEQNNSKAGPRKYFLLGFLTALTVLALAAIPGSTEDPVVTRSYLDDSFVWQNVELSGAEHTLTLRRGGEFAVTEVGEEFRISITGDRAVFLTTGEMEQVDLAETGLSPGEKYMWTGEERVEITFEGSGELLYRRGKVE